MQACALHHAAGTGIDLAQGRTWRALQQLLGRPQAHLGLARDAAWPGGAAVPP